MGTTYYVRAYATNAIGTSYGANQSFTTLSSPQVQTAVAVLIGTQVWKDNNLNIANYRNGEAITYAENATQWINANALGQGAYMYLKYASADGGATYGKLYNWYAVNDTRGLAPAGYHIPTVSEWTTLTSGRAYAGLKSTSTDWGASFANSNNNLVITGRSNTNIGNNWTGFNALPGGNIQENGGNSNTGSGWFWTADAATTNKRADGGNGEKPW
jgi:uncharacterized protein (TIGR02145 family)